MSGKVLLAVCLHEGQGLTGRLLCMKLCLIESNRIAVTHELALESFI